MTFQKNTGAVRRFSRAMKFANWLQELPAKLTPPPFRLMQIGSAFWQSRALYVSARLDIATVLGNESLSIQDIADRVSAQPDAVFRLMRMLASLGVFEEVSPRAFKNNKVSHHLRQDHPKSVREMVLMHNSEEMSRPWYEQLENGIRSGGVPFERVFNQGLFTYMDDHGEFDALFSRAMDRVESLTGDSFATEFDWGRFNRVIDIGGSKGRKSIAILKRHPHLKSLVVDREPVISDAQYYWIGREDPGLLARLSFEVGDVLNFVPMPLNDKDIVLLSAILHGFDDDTCVKILQNLSSACAETGARIALFELVVAEKKADLVSTTFDLQMFVGTRGRERTSAEWTNLFKRSGLMLEEQVSLCSFGKILVLKSGNVH